MTERKWTAGPWVVRYRGGETQLVMGDGDIHMCDMIYYPWVPENVADWHLIAAAPEMADYIQVRADAGDVEAQRIMAKARGESE